MWVCSHHSHWLDIDHWVCINDNRSTVVVAASVCQRPTVQRCLILSSFREGGGVVFSLFIDTQAWTGQVTHPRPPSIKLHPQSLLPNSKCSVATWNKRLLFGHDSKWQDMPSPAALKKKDLLTLGIQQTPFMKLEFGRSDCGCSFIEGGLG